jgi:hypothetical protein
MELLAFDPLTFMQPLVSFMPVMT